MTRFVVDTNVPIVANGRTDATERRSPSIDCRISAIETLENLLKSGKVLLDLAGEIQLEYRKYLNARGQPGVGDRFYQEILNSAPTKIERVELAKRPDGQFADLPAEIIDSTFDQSDRKFAALAKLCGAPVLNATDSDWLHHRVLLNQHGINVTFVCGCDEQNWFQDNANGQTDPRM